MEHGGEYVDAYPLLTKLPERITVYTRQYPANTDDSFEKWDFELEPKHRNGRVHFQQWRDPSTWSVSGTDKMAVDKAFSDRIATMNAPL